MRLPEKPSALIRLALKDLRGCEANPLHFIDMGAWHEPVAGGCAVCLAGAVMAGTLGVALKDWVGPDDVEPFDEDWDVSNKLHALNLFRMGSVQPGLDALKINKLWPDSQESAPEYEADDPQPFHAYLADLADRFERVSL